MRHYSEVLLEMNDLSDTGRPTNTGRPTKTAVKETDADGANSAGDVDAAATNVVSTDVGAPAVEQRGGAGGATAGKGEEGGGSGGGGGGSSLFWGYAAAAANVSLDTWQGGAG